MVIGLDSKMGGVSRGKSALSWVTAASGGHLSFLRQWKLIQLDGSREAITLGLGRPLLGVGRLLLLRLGRPLSLAKKYLSVSSGSSHMSPAYSVPFFSNQCFSLIVDILKDMEFNQSQDAL